MGGPSGLVGLQHLRQGPFGSGKISQRQKAGFRSISPFAASAYLAVQDDISGFIPMRNSLETFQTRVSSDLQFP